jgi:hypothetical protein
MNSIKFAPLNEAARNVVASIRDKMDGRKKFNETEVEEVISYAFAHSHKPYFDIVGHPQIVDELINQGIFKRHSGKRNLTLAKGLVDFEAEWTTTEFDESFPTNVMTKSKTFYISRKDCLHLTFDEIDAVSYMPAHLLVLLDMKTTLSAWKAGYKPSLFFERCDYIGRDEAEIQRWNEFLEFHCQKGQWSIVPIKGSLVCANPTQAGRLINNLVTQFTSDYQKNFAMYSRDRYGRESTSYGGY